LSALVAYHIERGEHPEALRHARRLLALEPWQEEAHRQVMRLLALDGQRSAALRQYHECVRLLERELGLPPSEATTALYEEIRTGPPNREAHRLVPLRPLHNLPARAAGSIGRESEPAASQGAPSVGGQKRVIAVFCADVSASFHRSAAISPEGEADLIGRFLGVVERALGAFGGRRARLLGGRAIIPFGLEQTHESDAEQALRAALELVFSWLPWTATMGIRAC
jgi:class 3 adenylate cyclase